jgi:predicted aspartyl protease
MAVIEGVIDEHRQGRLPVKVRGLFGTAETTAIVDTGFNGGLSLPVSLAVSLGLVLVGIVHMELADGTVTEEFVFQGWAQIGELPEVSTQIIVTFGGEVLIGTELLDAWGARLLFDLSQRKTVVMTA